MDRLRYCQTYYYQSRPGHSSQLRFVGRTSNLPGYKDDWTRYVGYVPPAKRSRLRLETPGGTYCGSQKTLEHGAISGSSVDAHSRNASSRTNVAFGGITRFASPTASAPNPATEYATEAHESSLFPIGHWRSNEQELYDRHDPAVLAAMTDGELQQEIFRRQLAVTCYDRGHLLFVLTRHTGSFLEHFLRLRQRSLHSLRWMTPHYKIEIDIFYPYSARELAFKIAEKLACDAVKYLEGHERHVDPSEGQTPVFSKSHRKINIGSALEPENGPSSVDVRKGGLQSGNDPFEASSKSSKVIIANSEWFDSRRKLSENHLNMARAEELHSPPAQDFYANWRSFGG